MGKNYKKITEKLKKLLANVIVVSMIASILSSAMPTQVQAVGISPLAVFTDNFSDGNLDGWTTYKSAANAGVWSVNAAHQLTVDVNTTGSKAIASGTSFKDLVYDADIKLDGANTDNAGLLFRVNDPVNGADGYTGYYASVRWDNKFELGKVTSTGGWKSLKTVSSQQSGHMKVVAVGNNIKAYLNDMNTPLVDYTDTDTNAITTAGAIGVRGYWGKPSVSNIQVREYSTVETAAPTFDVSSDGSTVALSTTTTGAAIRFTTDGSMPNSNSTIYSSSIAIAKDTVIKAYAEKAGEMVSSVATSNFTNLISTESLSKNFDVVGDTTGITTALGNNTTNNLSYAVTGGKYIFTNPSGNRAMFDGTQFTNFRFDADINPGSGTSSGVIIRGSNIGNGADAYNGYFIGINPQGFIEVGRAANNWTAVLKAAARITANAENHLRVDAIGSHFYVYVNGDYVTDFTDSTYASGGIGLRAWYETGNITYDNVKVTNLTTQSADATLAELKVGGTKVTGFSPDTDNYSVQLTAGTTAVPAITYATTDSSATVVVNAPVSLPGDATVVVTGKDGTTKKTYTIHLTVFSGTFSDNFDAGSTSNWTTYGGTCSVLAGALTVNAGGGYKAVANGVDVSNFTYEADVSFNGGTDTGRNAGLIFRVTNPAVGADLLNGYYAGITLAGTIQVGRFDQKWTELANIPVVGGITEGKIYKLKVEAKGQNIDVYLDGQHIVDVVDNTYTHGAVGMRTWLTTSTYDNVVVQDTGAYANPVFDWSHVKGAVYVPTNAVNEITEWKFYDPVINERELSLAQGYGINSVRIFLHYLNWKNDKQHLMDSVEDFLTRADNHGIKTEVVFFDDCWDDHPTWEGATADLAPKYGAHNSRWVECPGDDVKALYNSTDDATRNQIRSDLKGYVKDIVIAHKNDSRVLFWDVYNEPGNGESGEMLKVTKQLMNDGRMWVKETGSIIPVSSTGGAFAGEPFSDFITWHPYDTAYANPYPNRDPNTILADEGMNRSVQTIPGMIQNYYDKGIGFIMWEFGIGRDNCRFPWGSDTNPLTSEVTMPFHGYIYPDGHPWSIDDAKAFLGSNFNNFAVYHVSYYRDNNFSDLAKNSITPRIDFDLGNEKGTGSPDATVGIGEDNFSTRWAGTIQPAATNTYTFYAKCDNVARIYINNTLVVDKTSNTLEEKNGTMALTGGQTYSVKVEYVHATGDSSLHVNWSSSAMPKTVMTPIAVQKAVSGVTLDKTTLSLPLDNTVKLTAIVSPLDASTQDVTWSSDNSAVASVDSNGDITGNQLGTAKITATTVDGNFTASCDVTVTATSIPRIPSGVIVDNFDSTTLNGAWTINNEVPANWNLTAKPGYLEISTPGGDMYQGTNAQKNVFLQNAPTGDFEIITKVNAAVVKNYEQAGPIIWQDQDNYIRFGYVYNGSNGGKGFETGKEVAASYSTVPGMNTATNPQNDRIYMKLSKVGNTYTSFYWNGSKWIQASSPATLNLSNIKIGLYATNASDSTSMPADFDYFAINALNPNDPPTGISIDNTATLRLNEQTILKTVIEPYYLTSAAISWSSDNPNVASVDVTTGVVTAKAVGKANIIATTVNGGFTASCAVTVVEAENTFRNPIVQVGSGGGSADPWVTFKDGYYYYCKVDADASIQVAKAKRLQDVGTEPRVTVYTPPTGTDYSKELWAPELHYINGKWYIYFTADAGSNAGHRMYVLEGNTQDPQGSYTLKGKIADSTNKWAIDGTVLQKDDGSLYFIWSGWPGDVDGQQNLYIAPMSDPWTISGDRVLISQPTNDWERKGGPAYINEGPEIIMKDGKIYILYSASGSWTDDYCLGMLTNTDGNVLNSSSWVKSPQPLFSKADSSYGTGHASFTKSPDGTEDWIVYHADLTSGASWGGRSVRAQKFTWNADGTPNFGVALPYGDIVTEPSGTPKIERYQYEAETAVLGGNAKKVAETNASGSYVAGNLDSDTDYVLFNVNVANAGDYQLALVGDCNVASAQHNISVNGGENQAVNYANKGLNNFTPSFLKVALSAGANTIKVSKAAGSAQIDQIILEKVGTTPTQSNNADLSGIKVGGSPLSEFTAGTTSYTVTLPVGTTAAPAVLATTADSKAVVEVTQASALAGTTIIKVTAEDGTTKTYSISFIVQGSTGGVLTNEDPSKVVDAVNNAPDNSNIDVQVVNNKEIGKEIFDAIKGKDKTLTLVQDVVQWIWNGKDITGETKAIDATVNVEPLASTTSHNKVAIEERLFNKDVIVTSFANNGQLPAKTTIRLKLSESWLANKDRNNVTVNYYNEATSNFEPVATGLKADANNFIQFYITHNSDYIVLANNISSGGSSSGGGGSSSTIITAEGADNATVSTITNATTITTKNGTLQISSSISSVIWTITNEDGTATDKATIDSNGLLTAKRNGVVKVTATSTTDSKLNGSVTITISGQGPATARLGGSSRYETSVKVSQSKWDTSDYAVIANGEEFADALCAAPFAKQINAPILLTSAGSIDKEVLNELSRLKVKKVYLIGGNGAVSASVEDAIKGMSITTERISGNSRYTTSLAIAQKLNKSDTVFLCAGSNFPDALSVSSYAAANGNPILLVGNDAIDANMVKYIEDNNSKVYVIGGTALIPDSVLSGITVTERIFGANRYSTNLAVLNKFSSNFKYTNIYLAQGENFPDAICGSVLAGTDGAPVVLVNSSVSNDTVSYIKTILDKVNKVNILGSEAVIPSQVVDKVLN